MRSILLYATYNSEDMQRYQLYLNNIESEQGLHQSTLYFCISNRHVILPRHVTKNSNMCLNASTSDTELHEIVVPRQYAKNSNIGSNALVNSIKLDACIFRQLGNINVIG